MEKNFYIKQIPSLLLSQKNYNNDHITDFFDRCIFWQFIKIHSLLEICLSVHALDFFFLLKEYFRCLYRIIVILYFNIDFYSVWRSIITVSPLCEYRAACFWVYREDLIYKHWFKGKFICSSGRNLHWNIEIYFIEQFPAVFTFEELHQSMKCQNAFNILRDRYQYPI